MTMASGIKISPNPPLAGGTATITVPGAGPWYVFITDTATGAITERGPLTPGPDSTIEVDVPAGTEGDILTVTDEGEPIPTDEDYEIVSTE